ncbi:fertilization-influencing membrane protein [Talpa occidentalis]|uniref:fertilization-influencing membrane protein n=1 Tax=Talpa occidentalis TaxID=50954 RepID=UPI0023F70DD6|nr:fertilization-influencing membrane protein [Talpa occidentalis]
MRLWQWAQVWVWLVGPGVLETASSVKTLAPGEKSPLFIDRRDFFDYPDSDQARLLAVAKFIGESPVIFGTSGSSSGGFYYITVGFLVVTFLFLLFQFCKHMSFQKGA